MHYPLNIVAGENIPYLEDAFEDLGNLTILPGRSITSAHLQNAQALLIRSITQVAAGLLQGTPIKFVGSASAGTDHLDIDYLQSQNITFTSASGSNANSVAEYVMAALLFLGNKLDLSLKGKTIGIVGVGNIGKLVKQKAEALHMYPLLHDPPLADSGQIISHSLEETLSCDVVTFHTPLTYEGPYPTYHLLNEHTVNWLKPSTIFINAARGEVVNTSVLLDAIIHQKIGPTVIDVWEHEPAIDWDLFQNVTLGTPHIAGHSLEGKANGTFMIYNALCKHVNREPTWNPAQSLPPPIVPVLELPDHIQTEQGQIHEVLRTLYDIETDHHQMQQLLTSSPEERPTLFDALRRHYPIRREFHQTTLKLPSNTNKIELILKGLGFEHFIKEG